MIKKIPATKEMFEDSEFEDVSEIKTIEKEVTMSDKVSEKKDKAIKAIRDYLVELLEEEKWCEANKIGEALRHLVDPYPAPFMAATAAEAQMRAQQQMNPGGILRY